MEWIRGDFLISEVTLNRFFALHVVALPLVLVMLVFVHIVALHHVGSNNPDGVEIKKNKNAEGVPLDGIPFHPYYTIGHDLPGIVLFLIVFCAVVFYMPEMGGYFIEKPELRRGQPAEDACPHRAGVVLHAVLRNAARRDVSAVRSRREVLGLRRHGGCDRRARDAAVARPQSGQIDPLQGHDLRSSCWRSSSSASSSSAISARFPPSQYATLLAQICTVLYFAYFVLMPWYTRVEKTKPAPERVTMR